MAMAFSAASSWKSALLSHSHGFHSSNDSCSGSRRPPVRHGSIKPKLSFPRTQRYGNCKHTPCRAMASSPSFSSPPSSSSSSSSLELATKLSSISILTCSGVPVQFKDLWDQTSETAVVAFLRHFGCFCCWEFAASLRDLKPRLDASGVKLIAIGVGPPEKARILAEKLPFPEEVLYADPERKAYNALGLYHGIARTFLNPASSKILGRLDAIREATKGYTIEATPNDTASVLQQGGVYVFKGKRLVFGRKDEGTGDHASLDDVLNACCSKLAV